MAGTVEENLERILGIKRELEDACGFRELTGGAGHMVLRSGAANRVEAGCPAVHARCVVHAASGKMAWYVYSDPSAKAENAFSIRVEDDAQASSQELAWRISRAARAVRTVSPGGLLEYGVQGFSHLLRAKGVGEYDAEAFARMIFDHSTDERARAVAYAISDLAGSGVSTQITVQPNRNITVRTHAQPGVFEAMSAGVPKSLAQQRSDDPRTMREDLQEKLRERGYLMEYDAGAIPGENHVLVRASDGVAVCATDPGVPADVLDMARQWGDLTDTIECSGAVASM